MALGGLAIGIGKMANGSVIMVENIFRFIGSGDKNTNVISLTGKGAKEVGNFLFSASLIIIFVFLPLLTLEGMGGRMFRPTAFAVAAALFGALIINIPMTFAGGIIALFIAGQTLNVSSLIGLIAPFGIALQNGIILIGKINSLRKGGLSLHEAVLQGSVTRFRPILMTELILILGVLPLILGSTSGSELHQPLAVVYIGGFLVAIFFEQIVLPVLYEMFAKLRKERAF